ncbi:uncharacterized protein LOC131680970 [Topomyia yanbarensis]|uniref:uncharacterized protein LOC131680970 n=1 Tax=Topomyia yanbarensis TaxID=2498891 RepID=UPI00273B1033|nr:uncharacterized protein LOC131680970 [Topomyia yanbarensis]
MAKEAQPTRSNKDETEINRLFGTQQKTTQRCQRTPHLGKAWRCPVMEQRKNPSKQSCKPRRTPVRNLSQQFTWTPRMQNRNHSTNWQPNLNSRKFRSSGFAMALKTSVTSVWLTTARGIRVGIGAIHVLAAQQVPHS